MNAEYIAKKLEAITVIQNGETTKPLQEFADFVRQQQAEIEALRSLSLRKENLGYFYDLHTIQQAEIEALKKFKAEIDAENKKLFEAVQRANDVWDKATGKAQEK